MAETNGVRELIGSDSEDQVIEITCEILAGLFRPYERRDFAVRLWNGQILPAEIDSPSDFTLVLNHPGALRRMLFPPGELTLAEAYLRGDFDIEGNIIASMRLLINFDTRSRRNLLQLGRQVLSLPRSDPPELFDEGRQPVHLQGQRHSRQRDRAAISYHYDVGNDFYALFLGKWMAYSSAYFTDPDNSLDAAQSAKFEHICRKLRLKPGERLLDIGCGWGGLVVYAAENYGVQVTGITLGKPQAEYGRKWIRKAGLVDHARIVVQDYRELDVPESYDKIVSVGMFEHVGRERMREYFSVASRVLRPGGVFLNHGIAESQNFQPGWIERKVFQRGEFAQRYVFPDGELLPISEALTVAESAGFEIRDVESLREHYALTLQNWIRNLEERKKEVVRIKDERTYRVWRLYMAGFADAFIAGEISIFQTLLSKNQNGKANLPLTREALYAERYTNPLSV